ncbi:MAG TPA: zinc-ribbon domain containing protein [Candidatus Limnocylindria bacterium]|jgi:hypothetical protein|nr:zinc-ribbon domain containing protein [Candidatus Limnocylindria bacterium]
MDANGELKAKRTECVECGEVFTIAVGEQRFMLRMGFPLPKRCKPCRKVKASEAGEVRHAE